MPSLVGAEMCIRDRDVSHKYPKMYVIRPQFFIPMITVLRNAAIHSLKYKTELAQVRAQHIDITNFETKLEKFKTAFGKNYDLAARKFSTAIDEIDKSIDFLSLKGLKQTLPIETWSAPLLK